MRRTLNRSVLPDLFAFAKKTGNASVAAAQTDEQAESGQGETQIDDRANEIMRRFAVQSPAERR